MLGKDVVIVLIPEAFKKIKQNNICNNPEKAKERIRETWRNLDKSKRDEILTLSGQKNQQSNVPTKLAKYRQR